MQKIGKEIKIGLAVIGVLVVAFGYILCRRLTRTEDVAAAPAAAAAPSALAPAAGASDKPTVVSATDTARPADPAAPGASAPRSLFGSTRRVQSNDPADAGAEPRGSFMPAANTDTTANNAAPGKTAASASSAAPATDATAASPENRFSQFGRHDVPPASGNGTAALPAPTAADTASTAHPEALSNSANGKGSLFTAANTARPADATAAPSDPFQRNSAVPTTPVANDSPDRRFSSPLDAPVSPRNRLAQGNPPADPPAPLQTTPNDSSDPNPLRHAHEGLARTASATSETVPPPVTPNAINVPSAQQVSPSEPVSPVKPLTAEVAAPKPGQYIVQANDNYWSISEKVYGTGGYFKAIFEHNRRQHAQSDRLQVGDALDVPEVAVLQQTYPELCPKSGHDTAPAQTTSPVVAASPVAATSPVVAASAVATAPPGTRSYAVAEGDTLYEIARRELGRALRWGEIYQLNHDQLGNDFGYLRPGTQLLIPSDGAAASLAREPNGTLQR